MGEWEEAVVGESRAHRAHRQELISYTILPGGEKQGVVS